MDCCCDNLRVVDGCHVGALCGDCPCCASGSDRCVVASVEAAIEGLL